MSFFQLKCYNVVFKNDKTFKNPLKESILERMIHPSVAAFVLYARIHPSIKKVRWYCMTERERGNCWCKNRKSQYRDDTVSFISANDVLWGWADSIEHSPQQGLFYGRNISKKILHLDVLD